jgi:hypothetical protein
MIEAGYVYNVGWLIREFSVEQKIVAKVVPGQFPQLQQESSANEYKREPRRAHQERWEQSQEWSKCSLFIAQTSTHRI